MPEPCPREENPEMNIVLASSGDEPWIRQLLTLCGLPHEDLTPEHLSHFWVIKERGEILGTAGLEIHGQSALLRSLAVDPQFHKRDPRGAGRKRILGTQDRVIRIRGAD